MKNDDKAAWRPRRFDVAGAHPDEVYRAVANISEAVDEIRKQFIDAGYGRHVPDDAVEMAAEQALALRQCAGRGRAAVSGAGRRDHGRLHRLPLGARRQREVRNRCDELAKSMEKVLAQRPDERPRQRFGRKPRMRI